MNHLVRDEPERTIEIFTLDPESERRQIESVQRVRAERDADAVAAAIERVKQAAASDENLMPSMIEAVKVHATHGELCDAMREVFGTYTPDSLTTGV